MKSPVLFLIFNRPDTTARVLDAIRLARPSRLYVAADGPRMGRQAEAALCEQARQLIASVDWPCEVKTLFRDQNLGCKKAVSQGINWFFEHEEQGVILEDDCLPEPSFFDYCDELLERYKDDPRVMCISGDNFVAEGGGIAVPDSYYFSSFIHIWGWASWRRAWTGYDVDMKGWSVASCEAMLARRFPRNAPLRRYWLDVFQKVASGGIDTWDYQWTYRCWSQEGVACLPGTNLISNIGFDARATHTLDPENKLANMSVHAMSKPLRHPSQVKPHAVADAWSAANLFTTDRYSTRRMWGRQLKAMLGLTKKP